ncbi:MAG: carboxymethylenebutenolidase, partial [Alphaproteobacteria bacterium]|nr:carboxymethylenebutenolidase [Alphaproteobacteria bacterium]
WQQGKMMTAPLGRYETYRNPTDGTDIESYFAVPAKVPAPTVLMLRGIAGPDSGYSEIADRLAAHGYAALVHRWQVRGDDPPDAPLIEDIRAALAFLRGRPEVDPGRIAAFGYCKGGGQALLAAAELPEIRVVVAFHGFARRPDGPDAAHRNPLDVAERIKRPVLLLHGEDDTLSRLPTMMELSCALNSAGAAAELHVYPGANHGFAVSTHKGYQTDAANDSFSRGVAFLAVNLR